MKKLPQSLAILLAFGTLAFPVHAQGHYRSFIVSTYATQGTVRSLMDGDIDPAEVRKWIEPLGQIPAPTTAPTLAARPSRQAGRAPAMV